MINKINTKVKVIQMSDFNGVFEISPLEKGFAATLATMLRRVLLTSISGAAVTGVRVHGAKHEYTTLDGVEEDVLRIILNLKLLKLRMFTDEPQTLFLNIKKAGSVTAGDIEQNSNVEVLNPELVIANLADSNSSLSMEIIVEKGSGYRYVDNEKRSEEIGFIPLDATFSPIAKVATEISSARVGADVDYDKLTITIDTKSILPNEAIIESLEILGDFTKIILDLFKNEA